MTLRVCDDLNLLLHHSKITYFVCFLRCVNECLLIRRQHAHRAFYIGHISYSIDIKTMNLFNWSRSNQRNCTLNGCTENVSLKVKNIHDAYVHILNSTCTEWMDEWKAKTKWFAWFCIVCQFIWINSCLLIRNCNQNREKKTQYIFNFPSHWMLKCFPLFDRNKNENRKCHWH